MVTGIETAGVVLALLPFFVKSLSDYADGIDSLQLFRTGRYSRRFHEWSCSLETERVIMMNTVTDLLCDLIDDEELISAMKRDANHEQWRERETERELQRRLGEDYGLYLRLMKSVRSLLLEMEEKLGSTVLEDPEVVSSRDKFTAKFRAFKHIFSKDVYEDIFNRINRINSLLRDLTEQRRRHDKTRSEKLASSTAFMKLHNSLRKHMATLFNILIRGQKWKCHARYHNHMISLVLEPFHDHANDKSLVKGKDRFGIIFHSDSGRVRYGHSPGRPSWREHILEAEATECRVEQANFGMPERINGQVLSRTEKTPPASTRRRALAESRTVPSTRRKTVAFATSSHNPIVEPMMASNASVSNGREIGDLCSACMASGSLEAGRKHLGCLINKVARDQTYELYLVRALDEDIYPRSLQEVLMMTWSQRTRMQIPVLTRRDCLHMAATLALNVLRLQGNWFRAEWTLQDIVLPEVVHTDVATGRPAAQTRYSVEAPYLSWSVVDSRSENLSMSSLSVSRRSALIKCPTLFPLGLALVELGLCRPLSEIPSQDGDDDLDPMVAKLKKATRLLPNVLDENGGRYRDVVEECLTWPSSRPQDHDLEDSEFQRAVCQYVVLPLVNNLKAFDGE